MRGRGAIAGVLAVCGAVALSAPARADQYDYIAQLDNMGVFYESMIDMIDIGKELCHELRFGVTPSLVLGKLQRTGFAPTESAIVLMAAVDNMCVDTRQSWAGHATTGIRGRRDVPRFPGTARCTPRRGRLAMHVVHAPVVLT